MIDISRMEFTVHRKRNGAEGLILALQKKKEPKCRSVVLSHLISRDENR